MTQSSQGRRCPRNCERRGRGKICKPLASPAPGRPPRYGDPEPGDLPDTEGSSHPRREESALFPAASILPSRLPPITLVLGGARSGKSAYAERLVADAGVRGLYLATAEAHDAEMAERIRQHRERRGAAWDTLEEPLDVTGALRRHAAAGRPILVDCLTLWISNLMAADRDIGQEAEALTSRLCAFPGAVVLVSNEVGLGIVPQTPLGRAFRDHAGRVNQRVAAVADRVVLVVAGLPLTLKEFA